MTTFQIYAENIRLAAVRLDHAILVERGTPGFPNINRSADQWLDLALDAEQFAGKAYRIHCGNLREIDAEFGA